MAFLLTADRQSGHAADRPVPAAAATAAAAPRTRVGLLFVYLLVLGMLMPFSVWVGPLRLSPYRLVLILAFIPILYALATGAWRLRTPDVLIMLYTAWTVVAFLTHHGLAGGLEPAGIHVIEVFGAYGLARSCVRSQEDFERVLRVFLISLLFLLPVAVYEALTGHIILWDIAGLVFDTFQGVNRESRLGLQRAHGPFQHPILYGVYCASLLGTLVLTVRGTRATGKRVLMLGLVGAATFLSLSAGPLVALVVQLGMLCWVVATQYLPYKWWIFLALGALSYITIDILSNRTPFEVLISYGTFNQGNAYNRVHIWNFGSAEVLRHPFLGIGLNEWQNGWWMSQSMDNFWLYNAVRFGLPALVLLSAGVLGAILMIGLLRHLTPEERNIRTGWAIAITGLIIAGGTVHFWNALLSHFFFILGSAMWLLEMPSRRRAVQVEATDRAGTGPTPATSGPARAHAGNAARVLETPRSYILGRGEK